VNQAKIGILPFWLKLYDDSAPEARPRIEAFVRTIAQAFEQRGVAAVAAPVCRLEKEFAAAVKRFERDEVDAIVTLHLAYSPSLEASGALARTRLPILVLDTTPTFAFGPAQDPAEIMHNHGIHGVQDMCNLLVRNRKPFAIEAGHWEKSDAVDRIVRHLPAARMAALMGRGRVGLMGTSFKGMGDFYTPPAKLKATVGGTVKTLDAETLKKLVAGVKTADVEAELAEDRGRFDGAAASGTAAEAHRRSVRLGLALRKWIERERLAAFSFNFLDMKKSAGHVTVPFLEASKAMARGTGYAGEGDVLTALLVAAVAAGFPETTFTEMFCPDWENGTVFLSHMGEVNWRLLDGRGRLGEMDYGYSATDNPVRVTGRLRPGSIVLVNLAPMADDRYRLILAPATMLPVSGPDRMEGSVHGWFRPQLAVSDFLEAYSRAGGTHHLAMCYAGPGNGRPGDAPGAALASLKTFGRLMGWDTVVIGS
jgi:L-arabinose isomerase